MNQGVKDVKQPSIQVCKITYAVESLTCPQMTCYCPVPRNSQAHVQPIMGNCNCYGGVYEWLQTSVQHMMRNL